MLKKLLKYDFKSLFKFWWIASVACIGLASLAGGCIPILKIERDIPEIIEISAVFIMILAFMGIGVFSVFTMVMIFIRFYKNLFSDEGYLTFTLPVKRSTILGSKILSGTLLTLATSFVCFLSVGIALSIGFGEEIYSKEFFEGVLKVLKTITSELGIYFYIYILEILTFAVLSIVFSILFLYTCITLAATITKKAKVITSIGIYYGANSVFTFVFQIFFTFGILGIVETLEELPENQILLSISLILLCFILLIGILCSILYVLQCSMLERKLNLA